MVRSQIFELFVQTKTKRKLASKTIVHFIFAARRLFGITIVLIEHDMAVVMSIADQVLALNYGKMLSLGVPKDIRTNQAVIDAYFGTE